MASAGHLVGKWWGWEQHSREEKPRVESPLDLPYETHGSMTSFQSFVVPLRRSISQHRTKSFLICIRLQLCMQAMLLSHTIFLSLESILGVNTQSLFTL